MPPAAVAQTQAGLSHQAALMGIQVATARRLREQWAGVDRDNVSESWVSRLPAMAQAVAAGQLAAAGLSDGYLDRASGGAAASGRVLPQAFAGVASDGRDLGTLLTRPLVTTLARLGAGESVPRAMALGLATLDVIGRTQVGDAGRSADQVAMASRRSIGAYTRAVEPDACNRCVVLAGRRYQWDQAFLRHPQCACSHEVVPPGDELEGADPRAVFDRMDRATQDRRFGVEGAQAIREGADMSQVVNSRRGISSVGSDRRGARFTSEGVTARGRAGRRLGGLERVEGESLRRSSRPRLTPEAIIREARSRDEAIGLLGEHGYLG